MNVLVIRTSGKSGELVAKRALAAGHTVTAFVHDVTDYQAPTGVQVAIGDATDKAAVDEAVARQDAVIDAIGGHAPFLTAHLEQSTRSSRYSY